VVISVLLLPGIGVSSDLARAADNGAEMARIATHCTEARFGAQHITLARKLGLEAVGFLMMAHMTDAEELAEEAKVHEAAGAQTVYCTDTAGALTPPGVAARIAKMRDALEPATAVGFHGHNNLGLSVGNTLTAIQEGAESVDLSLRGLGAGAGNTPTEVFVAVCDRMGIPTGVDIMKLADAAEDLVAPLPQRPQIIDRASLIMGWAGVGNSFMLPAERAARQYGVSTTEILLEAGRRKVISGQEDLILPIALDLAARKGAPTQ
jgi:4-hydroxy-2-oxovalerate/4-hydroxy-2-oxohexanoate aldolase